MLTKTDILNGGGYPNTYWEFSNLRVENGGHVATLTIWEHGKPYLTYTDKGIWPASNHFTQDRTITVQTGVQYVNMSVDSAALGDLAELQKDATAKAGYLGSEGATWFNKETYAFEYAETTAEIDILKTLLSGQTTAPAGTGTQPEGTQPAKAGLKPVHIGIGLSVAALAVLALTKGVKA